MHDSPTQSSDRLDQIIAEYLAAEESGAAPPPDDVVAANPELAEELRNFFANRDQLHGLAAGLPGETPRKQFVPPKVRYFGDYELIDEIARGGMGVVYRAKQTSLNRIVAIKMILSGHLASEEDVKRFRTEAEAAANLKHPGIVPVHEVGVHQGQHYFSMDYIEGRSLAEIVRENPLAGRKAAEYVRSIADAVHYAHNHEQGTLHRDLKPSNILIDGEDHVHVTDFGLAVRVEGDSELTRTGDILGTPAYMPPEQAQSKRGLIGPGSDVYALGAILYELLTGRPPFRGESPVETLTLVVEAEPLSPRLLNPKVPRDLETICLKCLQKEPHKRYLTAGELAADLGRFLEGEPIQARPVGRIERAWRWCRRKPAAAGLLASVLLLVVGVFAGALWYVNDRGERRAEAVRRETVEAQRVRQLEQGIEDALRNVNLLREKSWTLTDRVTDWAAMLASARAEHRRAEALIEQAPDRIDPALQSRVAELGGELDVDERDQRFAARYEEIALEVAAPKPEGRTFRTEDLYPKLCESLVILELHVAETAVTDATERLLSRPTPVRTIWIAAFDACLRQASFVGSDSEREWFQSVLRAVDSNPWRNAVRAGFADRDLAELVRLAKRADVAAQPTALLLALAGQLLATGPEEEALSLLLRMHAVHPEDFWVNMGLGDVYLRSGPMGFGGDEDDPLWRPDLAARYFFAALAVRPDNVAVLSNLGIALKYADDLEGAERELRRVIELRPDLPSGYSNLGLLLERQERFDEARQCYLESIKLDPNDPRPHDDLGRLLLLLGVGHYQSGRYGEAIQELNGSLEELGPNAASDSFLAMAHWQLNQQDEARECFDKAVEWMDENEPENAQLLQLRAAAGELLGVASSAPGLHPADPGDATDGSGALVYRDSVVRDDMDNVVHVDISDDGRFVYAASYGSGSVSIFARNAETGDLKHVQKITRPDRMSGAVCVRLSNDGRLAAVTAFQSHEVLLYERDSETGMLTELDAARCTDDGVSGICWAMDAAFSPDARFLYVVGSDPGALAWFRLIDGKRLEFAGVIRSYRYGYCFANARGICMSPDGETLYVTSAGAGTLTVLDVDPETGEPTIDRTIHNIRGGDGLAGAMSVTCSSDGRFVYTNSGRFGGDNAVCVFERREGALVLLEVHRNGVDGVKGLRGGNELVISPDGLNLYALGTTAGAIACFDRDPDTGRLVYRQKLVDGVAGVGPLGLVAGVAVSPDGRHVYAAADEDNAISIFERR